MLTPLRLRFWFEAVIASLLALLTLLTALLPTWVEALTGFDPDSGTGSLERMLVATLAVGSALVGAAARREWRLARATATASV
jgi:hypothetical protein